MVVSIVMNRILIACKICVLISSNELTKLVARQQISEMSTSFEGDITSRHIEIY